MSLTAQTPQPKVALQFESSNVDSVTGLAPNSSTFTPTALQVAPTYVTGIYRQAINFNNTLSPAGQTPNSYVTYDVSSFSLSSNSTTVSLWLNSGLTYPTTAGTAPFYVNLQGTNYNGLLTLSATSTISFRKGSSPITTIGSVTAQTGVWQHHCMVFSNVGAVGTSNIFSSYYVNGSLIGTANNTIQGFTTLNLGCQNSGSNGARCSIDDVRLFNTPLTATQIQFIYAARGMPGQAYLTAAGSGSGTPVDLAPSPATVPGSKASTAGPFSSEGSLSFTGTPGIQLSGSKFPFNWYTGFTVEAWVYYTSFTNALAAGVVPLAMGVMQIAGNIADWALGPDTSGRLRFYYYFTGQNAQLSSNTMSTGTWTHICAQHDGTSFHMYINGVRCVGPVTITGTVPLSVSHSYFSFGQYQNSSVPTYKIADARLVQGANVYPVTGFTPPTDKLGLSPVGTTIMLMQVPLTAGTASFTNKAP